MVRLINSQGSSAMKILLVQGILTSYRIPVFDELSQINGEQFTLLADPGGQDFGVDQEHALGFSWQLANWRQILGKLWITKEFTTLLADHDTVLHVGDFKYLTLWYGLVACLFSSKRIFLHGQGGYKRHGLVSNLVYSLSILLADGYICYTDFSRQHLKRKIPHWLHHKLSVCTNSLYLPHFFEESRDDADKLLFIGRLRAGAGIELLLGAAQQAKVSVRVIGGGRDEYVAHLSNKYPEAIFHGAIYDEMSQFELAKDCFAGGYGGDAGLSVVHYMAMGLPVVVHSDLYSHMGPEPSYLIDREHALLFRRGDEQDAASKIEMLRDNIALRRHLSQNCRTKYKELSNPSMAQRFQQILGKTQ